MKIGNNHGHEIYCWKQMAQVNTEASPTLSTFLSREASVGGAGAEGAVGSVLKAEMTEGSHETLVNGSSSGGRWTTTRRRIRYSLPGLREFTCNAN